YGDSETTEHFCYGPVRLNIGAKFVAAKEHLATEQRIAFAFEIKLFRQPGHFVAMLFHPFGKERLLTGAFFMTEIARNEFAANGQSSVGGKNHVWKSWLRRDQMNLAIQFCKGGVQLFQL